VEAIEHTGKNTPPAGYRQGAESFKSFDAYLTTFTSVISNWRIALAPIFGGLPASP
jgi:hypothetical protein